MAINRLVMRAPHRAPPIRAGMVSAMVVGGLGLCGESAAREPLRASSVVWRRQGTTLTWRAGCGGANNLPAHHS